MCFGFVLCGVYCGLILLDAYEIPSNPVPVPEPVSNEDTSEVDLGWKPEGRQKRKKGKQRSQEQEGVDLQLLEEESKVRCVLILFIDALRSSSPETPGAVG